MIGAFLSRHIWGVIAVFFALLIGGALLSDHHDSVAKERACSRLYAQSQTHHDTLEVAIRCELPTPSDGTTVVPVVVPVGGSEE